VLSHGLNELFWQDLLTDEDGEALWALVKKQNVWWNALGAAFDKHAQAVGPKQPAKPHDLTYQEDLKAKVEYLATSVFDHRVRKIMEGPPGPKPDKKGRTPPATLVRIHACPYNHNSPVRTKRIA